MRVMIVEHRKVFQFAIGDQSWTPGLPLCTPVF